MVFSFSLQFYPITDKAENIQRIKTNEENACVCLDAGCCLVNTFKRLGGTKLFRTGPQPPNNMLLMGLWGNLTARTQLNLMID